MRKLLLLLILLSSLTYCQWITTATVDSGQVTSQAVTLPDGFLASSFFLPKSMTTTLTFLVSDVGTTWYSLPDTLTIDSSKTSAAYIYDGLPFKYLKLKVKDTVRVHGGKIIVIKADE